MAGRSWDSLGGLLALAVWAAVVVCACAPGDAEPPGVLCEALVGQWGPAASMPEARYGHVARLLPDGHVFVVGGATPLTGLTYDPVANAWTPTGSMSVRRFFPTATRLLDGRVLVAGGHGLSSAELYVPPASS